VLAAWGALELRTSSPLVDLRLLAQPAILSANAAMLVAGAGMYRLFSLLTRYVQTPVGAGYGFGLPGVLAGAALIPFSGLGFVAGRLTRTGSARFSDRATYAAAAASVMVGAVLFAVASDRRTAVLVATAAVWVLPCMAVSALVIAVARGSASP
jgi:hypothetical protein